MSNIKTTAQSLWRNTSETAEQQLHAAPLAKTLTAANFWARSPLARARGRRIYVYLDFRFTDSLAFCINFLEIFLRALIGKRQKHGNIRHCNQTSTEARGVAEKWLGWARGGLGPENLPGKLSSVILSTKVLPLGYLRRHCRTTNLANSGSWTFFLTDLASRSCIE